MAASYAIRYNNSSDGAEQIADVSNAAAELANFKNLDAMAADFNYLNEHHQSQQPGAKDKELGAAIDVLEEGPMGLLWGSNPPDWFPA